MEKKKKKTKQYGTESNQSWSDRSRAKGGMDIDKSGGQDGRAHDKVDQTMDDRLSKDKLINNQAQLRRDAAEVGGSGNRWHNSMVEKRQRDKERKGRQMRTRDIK